MSDAETIIEEASDGKSRTPRGQKLPTCTPNDLRPLLEALRSFGGPISKARLATQTRSTVSSSGFKGRLGTAGYYGFVTQQAGTVELTDRGETFLSDDSAASRRASQEAVMSTGFAPVIQRQTTRSANADTIAALLAEMASVPERKAKATANELIAACEETGLINDERFDPEPIEAAMSTVGEITVTPAKPSASTRRAAPKPASNGASGRPAGAASNSTPTPEDPPGPFGTVSVVIQIDAAKLNAKEIKEIVQELALLTKS
jgi:hypothetical protein